MCLLSGYDGKLWSVTHISAYRAAQTQRERIPSSFGAIDCWYQRLRSTMGGRAGVRRLCCLRRRLRLLSDVRLEVAPGREFLRSDINVVWNAPDVCRRLSCKPSPSALSSLVSSPPPSPFSTAGSHSQSVLVATPSVQISFLSYVAPVTSRTERD